MMKIILSTFMFITLLVSTAHASPVTVTFDSNTSSYNPANNAQIGISQGFSYDFSYTYLTGAHIALHDDSGILSSTIRPISGALFTPHSVDVFGSSLLNKSGAGAPPIGNHKAHEAWSTSGTAPLPQLSFLGMRNGATVATQSVGPTAWSTTSFSKAFRGIDALLLRLNIPAGALRYTDPDQVVTANTLWCQQWCAEFFVDNLVLTSNTVAPVPLPAGAFLFISALLGLGLIKRRARA